jgi:hypothetical protein
VCDLTDVVHHAAPYSCQTATVLWLCNVLLPPSMKCVYYTGMFRNILGSDYSCSSNPHVVELSIVGVFKMFLATCDLGQATRGISAVFLHSIAAFRYVLWLN